MFGALTLLLQVFVPYRRLAPILKWLTLTLFVYVAAAFTVNVPWAHVLHDLVVPQISASSAFWMMIVAILGTTISPYLFFWQASEEVEERADREVAPVDSDHLRAMRVDVWAGMLSGVGVMFAIMCTAAVTIGKSGSVTVGTAEEAAKALEPLAGSFAKFLFATGIVGLGLLAVPVLAGSTAYAVAEAFHWNEGLSRRLRKAPGFYAVIVGSMSIGIALVGIGVNPIRALYLAAIFNGLTAPPLILLIVLLARSQGVLGPFRSGWASMVATSVAGIVMAAFPILAVLRS
jgi:Mn2+/Fe2+ NRAMP family transporter